MARYDWEVLQPPSGSALLQHGSRQMARMQQERWEKWRADVARWQEKQQRKKEKGAMIGGLLGLGLGFGIASAGGASMIGKLGGAQIGMSGGEGLGGLFGM